MTIIAVIAFMSGRQSIIDNSGIADTHWFSDFWQNFSTEMIGGF